MRRNGVAGSLWRGAKAGYHDYRATRLEEKAKRHRSMARLNPKWDTGERVQFRRSGKRLMLPTHRHLNPRRTIPGRALEIRYLRSDGKHYFHPFEHNVSMVANRDGSVTLRGGKRIWANDGEPGFWERYGHHPKRRRNPVARRRRRRQSGGDTNWLLIGAVGFIAYTLLQNGALANLVNTGGQNIIPQGAGTIWYSDPYTGGDSAFFTGSIPPGSAPPWRLASATEIGVRSAGLMTGSYLDAGGGLVAPNPGFLT